MSADNLIVLTANTIYTFSEYFSTGGWGLELGNEVLSTYEVITESDLTSLQNIFFNKASPRRCPSLRKSLHALVNKPTLSAQCPASTQIQNKGQVTVVLDLWNFLYFINFMFVCIKLTERSNSDFLEETYTEKQSGEKQFENSRTRFTGTHLIRIIPTTRYWLRSHLRRNLSLT